MTNLKLSRKDTAIVFRDDGRVEVIANHNEKPDSLAMAVAIGEAIVSGSEHIKKLLVDFRLNNSKMEMLNAMEDGGHA